MEKLELKYGLNPNQKDAYVYRECGLPIDVLNGRAGYINLLDALNGWQLVSDLKAATGFPSACSFKHVSPAGAAVGVPLTENEKRMYFVKDNPSPLAAAYIRARGTDRMSSFGDFIALSDICDVSTAAVIAKEVSDGIIAPGYEVEALSLLKAKKHGNYTIIQIDSAYKAEETEKRTVFGITFSQQRNDFMPGDETFSNPVTKRREIPESAHLDLIVSLLTLKYTQSNSVCLAFHGQTTGVGAGQQSRLHCTRLAADKSDIWQLRQCEKVLSLPFKKGLSRNDKDNVIVQYLSPEPEIDVIESWREYFTVKPDPMSADEKREYLLSLSGMSLASDAFFPFPDNIIRAERSAVSYISQPGGSIRDDLVIEEADKAGIVMFMTGKRLFHH
ncbi:MAG: phosphoribosylaminoimidazolecarboxamide formyltransferase [Spirochaetes bacterium]|uniref:Phosphoribosylaminoimidazolecarboxamide formyltransferase n=1 Tax=Candidatus Ornithospirochaeta stercoripullorum TaxID=2840899 RepID=A0A9D9DZU1_9SPIO|nr:phosphoribosylaminoimidazolecarboxamide formyltransferase [Candidatus Ornithospirochaeta stercoripullorum]